MVSGVRPENQCEAKGRPPAKCFRNSKLEIYNMGQPFNPGPYLQQKSKQQVREWQVEVNKECKGRSRIRQGHAFQGLRSLCIHMGVKEAFLHTVEI